MGRSGSRQSAADAPCSMSSIAARSAGTTDASASGNRSPSSSMRRSASASSTPQSTRHAPRCAANRGDGGAPSAGCALAPEPIHATARSARSSTRRLPRSRASSKPASTPRTTSNRLRSTLSRPRSRSPSAKPTATDADNPSPPTPPACSQRSARTRAPIIHPWTTGVCRIDHGARSVEPHARDPAHRDSRRSACAESGWCSAYNRGSGPKPVSSATLVSDAASSICRSASQASATRPDRRPRARPRTSGR